MPIFAGDATEIGEIVANIFACAQFPDRVTIGIAWQMAPTDDAEASIDTTRPGQVRIARIDANRALANGCILAQALRLMMREDFVLSLPHRHRLNEGWDSRLLGMHVRCEDGKAVLTAGIELHAAQNPDQPSQPVFAGFDERSRLPIVGERPVKEQKNEAVPSAFCRASLLFAPAQAFREVPLDPHISQNEEDISLSVRLWSWGWNIYTMPERILWPLPDAVHVSASDSNISALGSALSRKRLRHLLGIASSDEREPLRDLERFGLGAIRSVADFEQFAGIHFASQIADPRAREGIVGSKRAPASASTPSAGLNVIVSPARSLDLRKIRHGSLPDPDSNPPAPTPDLSGLERLPKKVLENDQVLIFDDFLPELIYDEVYRWAIYADYQHVNMGGRISRAWRPHDGFPMRSLSHCVFEEQPRHQGDKRSWEYPTKTAFDLMAERIDFIAPDAEKLIGRRGLDWGAFTIHSYIYPARSGMSLHQDHQPQNKGAFTYFMAPQWDIHWGGLLVVLDPRTTLGKDTVHLYGNGKASPNVWLDREREAPFVFDPGIGQVIMPKRNRAVFIRPDCYRMITYVNEYAGDNVRIDFSGHFEAKARVNAADQQSEPSLLRK
ncbi:GlcNAc-transferase family protein [Dongia sp.]|uniref:GlcNAc-transferase family protein n=1 Tax=Dongia sp. TaxID=1977262 RepID=UPI0035B37D93